MCTLRLFIGFEELKRCLVWHSPCHHQTKASLSLEKGVWAPRWASAMVTNHNSVHNPLPEARNSKVYVVTFKTSYVFLLWFCLHSWALVKKESSENFYLLSMFSESIGDHGNTFLTSISHVCAVPCIWWPWSVYKKNKHGIKHVVMSCWEIPLCQQETVTPCSRADIVFHPAVCCVHLRAE